MLQLTRFLYPVDECVLALMACLLKKAPWDECAFWLWEIEGSGLNVLVPLWGIYLDFYAERNPYLEGLLKACEGLSSEDERRRDGLACILTHMRLSAATPTVFAMRQYAAGAWGPVRARTKFPAEFDRFPRDVRRWLYWVNRKDLRMIAYLCSHLEDLRSAFSHLMSWLSGGRITIEQSARFLGTLPRYVDSRSYLMATVAHFVLREKPYKADVPRVRPAPSDMMYVNDLNTFSHIRPDRLLSARRLLDPDPLIRRFALVRDAYSGNLWRDLWRLHWAEHLQGVPYWDDLKRRGADLAALEPDEQLSWVQNGTISPLAPVMQVEWWKEMFGIEAPPIALPSKALFQN